MLCSVVLLKVETIGDAYMIVGGVPTQCDEHAMHVAEMAFAMLRAMKTLKDPSDKTGKEHLKLRVGMESINILPFNKAYIYKMVNNNNQCEGSIILKHNRCLSKFSNRLAVIILPNTTNSV